MENPRFKKDDKIAVKPYSGFFTVVDAPEFDNLLRVADGDGNEFWVAGFQVSNYMVEGDQS